MSLYVDIHTHRPTGRHIEPSGVGIHPWNADSEGFDDFFARIGTADIVGEIGLDALRGAAAGRQEEVLRRQLEAACERRMPVVLHCVRRFGETMRILADYPLLRAVIFHGFIGSEQEARQALKRGYLLSFGMRSLRSPRATAVLRSMPSESLFLETDDDPTPIDEVYAAAAEIRNTTVAELQKAILGNYERIFEKR